jgi:hypothetical protein
MFFEGSNRMMGVLLTTLILCGKVERIRHSKISRLTSSSSHLSFNFPHLVSS